MKYYKEWRTYIGPLDPRGVPRLQGQRKGLEPLAELILNQDIVEGELEELAMPFVNEELEVNTIEEAFQGAKDIIAELISDNANYRETIRNINLNKGSINSTVIDEEQQSVYEMYYDFTQAVKTIANHRVLAINRGKGKVLR